MRAIHCREQARWGKHVSPGYRPRGPQKTGAREPGGSALWGEMLQANWTHPDPPAGPLEDGPVNQK